MGDPSGTLSADFFLPSFFDFLCLSLSFSDFLCLSFSFFDFLLLFPPLAAHSVLSLQFHANSNHLAAFSFFLLPALAGTCFFHAEHALFTFLCSFSLFTSSIHAYLPPCCLFSVIQSNDSIPFPRHPIGPLIVVVATPFVTACFSPCPLHGLFHRYL